MTGSSSNDNDKSAHSNKNAMLKHTFNTIANLWLTTHFFHENVHQPPAASGLHHVPKHDEILCNMRKKTKRSAILDCFHKR